MNGAFLELRTTTTGEAFFDGELIVDADPFGAAIARAHRDAQTAGAPVLIRVLDEEADAVSWLEVDPTGNLSAVHAPESVTPEQPLPTPEQPDADDISALFTAEALNAAEPALAPARRLTDRRPVLIGVGCALGAAALAAAVWVGVSWATTAPSTEPSTPIATATPATEAVTLPGFTSEAAWSMDKVSAAASAGGRVLELSGTTATLHEATSGDPIAAAQLTGSAFAFLAGSVDGLPTLAATSDTAALVWAGDAVAPMSIDLTGGRRLTTRTGALVVVGSNWSFQLVTAAGLVPVTSPRPEMIVLGAVDGQVLWAGAPHQVVTASPNGTALREVTLTPPAAAASITPKTGWVRAATGSTVVVGWTLPDGSTITGVHSAATGELLAQIPGAGSGFLSADASAWVTDRHLVDLVTSTYAPLPADFIASRFLGTTLWGALSNGRDAMLTLDDSTATAVDAVTVSPFAVADGTLLTLTGDVLAGYPTE